MNPEPVKSGFGSLVWEGLGRHWLTLYLLSPWEAPAKGPEAELCRSVRVFSEIQGLRMAFDLAVQLPVKTSAIHLGMPKFKPS